MSYKLTSETPIHLCQHWKDNTMKNVAKGKQEELANFDQSRFDTEQFITVGSSLAISVINSILKVTLEYMYHIEKEHTETLRIKSAMQKMWLV